MLLNTRQTLLHVVGKGAPASFIMFSLNFTQAKTILKIWYHPSSSSIAFAYIFILHMSLFNYSQCRVFTYNNMNLEMHSKIETLFLLLEFHTVLKSICHWI